MVGYVKVAHRVDRGNRSHVEVIDYVEKVDHVYGQM